MRNQVSVTESVVIAASPQAVFDYTQDFGKRKEWDRSVLEAEVLEENPRRVRVKCRGGLSCEFRYKVFDRGARTSLAMEEVKSSILTGGGGAWTYAPDKGGTRWTQNNTLVLRDGQFAKFLTPLVRLGLYRSTRAAMRKAKAILESKKQS